MSGFEWQSLVAGQYMPVVPSEFWANKEPNEYANFVFDATDAITNEGVVDQIVGAAFATSPSGSGEITPSLLLVYVNYVQVWLAGGVPGRVYTHKLVLTLVSGVMLEIFIGQVCDPLLAVCPIPPAPTPGFGTTLTWP